ncbi:ammonium transporter [Trichococcus ilyis]|uniref:Ammonium transporter, Amt family n=1 Tax=Trichococcus ilyis TaxID=640938 RepID=A0A143YTA3_9LACT|nr:ammonium transporter [Trichococcus ilyis]CZQ96894.1 nitrogen regulatory protein pii [Trichococcus ilyis]SEJ53099.1 ammonium transporter, Amt family [Trichococcus ilyis]
MFSSVDTLWTLVGTVLVFFMQAGFAMVETGFTRAKNAANIIMKNLMDFVLGSLGFFLIGYSIMFGDDIAGIIGTPELFMEGLDSTIPGSVHFMFQNVFAATAATIVSGAVAERTKFSSYLVYSFLISLLIYPISGHWIWGGGWLAQMGFIDFAGSTAVHMVGGVAALVGAALVGPRIGKYKDGKAQVIPGHNLTLGALGVFILWFAWFGFNGASTVAATGDETLALIGTIFLNTNLSAVTATLVTLLFTWAKYGKPDVSMTLNGSLAGLVAITAGCAVVSPFGAIAIGFIAGFAIVLAVEFIDQKVKIDDPVGAFSVHGVNGALGTILVGIFATDGGLLYGGGLNLLGVQTLGVASVAAYTAGSMYVVFKVIQQTMGLRVTAEEEIVGMDVAEHGLTSSYHDFVATTAFEDYVTDNNKPAAVPAVQEVDLSKIGSFKLSDSGYTMNKVDIIANPDKLERLKAELNAIGVTGMTVTSVHGYGLQKGQQTFYRGAKADGNLLPKVRIETIISEVPVEEVIRAARRALYTGHVGDGKVFVSPVADAFRISNSDSGAAALKYY